MINGLTFQIVYTGVALEVRDWIFTFGPAHTDPRNGLSLRNAFVRIRGTWHEARRDMLEMFGLRWAHQYECEAEAGVERYSLWELPVMLA